MTLLAGIDFSTRRIDAALIPLDPDVTQIPPSWRWYDLPATTDPLERCRAARRAVSHLLQDAIHDGHMLDVTMVWVEEPFGDHRNANRALLPLFGAILSSIPARCEAAEIQRGMWLRDVGLPGNAKKPQAVEAADAWLTAHHAHPTHPLSEHQFEALLVALAGRHRCMRASAA